MNRDPASGALLGSYKVISADAHTKHGYNPHAVIFDELHAQPDSDLWDVMKTGMGARRQPLMIAITTAGFDKHSICYQQHTLAKSIIGGERNESFLPVIYGADDVDDWTDPEVWRKVQPNLGVSVPESFYLDECETAKQSPAYENTFRRLYLNQWTEGEVRWMQMARWDACGDAFDESSLEGRECFGGLDLASTRDVAAFSLFFPPKDGEPGYLLSRFWIPEDGAHIRSKRDGVPYTQ